MRQIIYFLTGTLIAFFLQIPFVNAESCLCTDAGSMNELSYTDESQNNETTPYNNVYIGGVYNNADDAEAALRAYADSIGLGDKFDNAMNIVDFSWSYEQYDDGYNTAMLGAILGKVGMPGSTYSARLSTILSRSSACPECNDTDFDGIPDECDFYPDDPDPYLIKRIGYTDDENGIVVHEIWETDRGDMYTVGTYPGHETGRDVLTFGTEWQDPSTKCSSALTYSDEDLTDDAYGGYLSGDSSGDGDLPSEYDPPESVDYVDGSDPLTETDTAEDAESKTQSNTAQTTDNTAAIADYIGDLNTIATDINNKLASIEQTQANTDLATAENEAAAEAGVTDFENLDETQYGDQYSGDLVEGSDYDDIGPLGDESWLTNFVSGNPVGQALESSGFQLTNAACEMELNLPVLGGTYKMSLCKYQSGFDLAGGIMVGLCSLAGLMMIVRGR